MNILILPSWYPSPDDPLNGSFFAEQAQALAGAGHRVTVFALYGDAPSGSSWEESLRGGVREFALHFRPLPLHLTPLRLTGALTKLFSAAFRGERPDIIHAHSFRILRYAGLLSRLYRIPLVVTEHVSWFERGLLSEKDKRAIAADYAAASEVIAVSRGLKEQIQPLCRRPVRVVPNLVDDRFFRSPLEKPPSDVFRFLSVGSLNRNKGMDALIAAFAETVKTFPAAELTICGDGEERPSLEQQAVSLGVAEKVTFAGRVSREQCAEYCTGCDAFVLASRVETFGLVLAEAMASGRPIVMTRTGAWRELCTQTTGKSAAPDDIPALAECMCGMIREAERYDPAAIREFCRERFSAAAVCRRLTEIYEEVLSD